MPHNFGALCHVIGIPQLAMLVTFTKLDRDCDSAVCLHS
jgi:hypothetical protein